MFQRRFGSFQLIHSLLEILSLRSFRSFYSFLEGCHQELVLTYRKVGELAKTEA
jgi:hypothetical protein